MKTLVSFAPLALEVLRLRLLVVLAKGKFNFIAHVLRVFLYDSIGKPRIIL